MKFLFLFLFLIPISAFASYLPFPVSSGGSLQRIEWATLNNNFGSCGPTGGISTAGWVTINTNNATGNCLYNINGGIFAATPVCFCTAIAGSVDHGCNFSSIGATSFNFWTWTGSLAENNSAMVMCIGPRAD